MVLKHMKECLISSRVRKMQVKTVLITYLIKLTKIYNLTIYLVLRLRVRGKIFLYITGGIKANETKQKSYEGELSKIINPRNLS